MTTLQGLNAAQMLREFFALQLRFAEVLALRGVGSLAHTLTFYTNLHRRFAYGNITQGAAAPAYTAFAERIATLADHDTRLLAIVAAFAERPVLGVPAEAAEFGCFRGQHPDARGHVRIHFANNDVRGDTSPLHHSKRAERRSELAALTAHLAREFPHTRAIDGGSWLYNIEAYRSLFPREFSESRKRKDGPRALDGGSTWGQFLDFRGHVKPALRDAFLARIGRPSFDVTQPWLAFELPVWTTSAPFAAFRREYGC